jgi:hypothetical protein
MEDVRVKGRGRGKREKGRGKREEGRGKREEGRGERYVLSDGKVIALRLRIDSTTIPY